MAHAGTHESPLPSLPLQSVDLVGRSEMEGVEGSELTPTSVVVGSEVMAVVSRENATKPDCDTEQ